MKFQDFQASSALEMADGTVLSACDRCRLDHEGKEPPCETCRIDLIEENGQAAEIYFMCRYQTVQFQEQENGEAVVRTDISIPAVEAAMRILGVKPSDQWTCLRRVRNLFHEMRAQCA